MRLSRSSRKKFKKRVKPHRAVIAMALSAFAAAQLSTTTYALFTAADSQEYVITSAFVFPKTVNDLAASAGQAAQEAAHQRDLLINLLQSLSQSGMTSAEAETLLRTMEAAAGKARQAASSANSLAAQLQTYGARSKFDVEQLKQDSVKVDTYVQAAYSTAVSAANEANTHADAASSLCAEAAVVAAKIKEAEEQAKKEAEEKARKEAEEKAKQEAEDENEQEDEHADDQEDEDEQVTEDEDEQESDEELEQKADQHAADKGQEQPAKPTEEQSTDSEDAEQTTHPQPQEEPAATQQALVAQQPEEGE